MPTAIVSTAAIAGSHGGGMNKGMKDKGMMQHDCAAMLKKMEGMKGEKYAMMRKEAMMKLKEGDEKGCMEALKDGMMQEKMNDGMKKKM
ncbi:MAG: hypothetical protein L3J57_07510 [Desulfuromusa sp.]|nr:hypothetical protein [Desulfuromusa sp.]